MLCRAFSKKHHIELSGKSGFNTLLPAKAGNSSLFFRQLTRNYCVHWPTSGFLWTRSLASNPVNSIRGWVGKLWKRSIEGIWKGTDLWPGCRGCVHMHERGRFLWHTTSSPHNRQVKTAYSGPECWASCYRGGGLTNLIPSWNMSSSPSASGYVSAFYWSCSSVTAAGVQHSLIFPALKISFNVLWGFVFWSNRACTVLHCLMGWT